MRQFPLIYTEVAAELAQRLRLRRPLAFVDLETTSNSPQIARIVEISTARVTPEGTASVMTRRVNPELPIPPESTAVHGIRDEDVQGHPTFRTFARELADFFAGCDLAGFGIARFDVRVLEAEFRRAGHKFSINDRAVVDSLAIYFDREPRDLASALRFYRGRELYQAHSAEADMFAAMEVLLGQLDRYLDLPRELRELDRLSGARRVEPNWLDEHGLLTRVNDHVHVNFGKYKGTPLAEVLALAPDYVDWMLKNDFPEDVKMIIRAAHKPKQGGQ